MKILFIAVSVILSALVFVSCTGKNNKEVGQYTCSMHPDVIQDHPGLCPICKMDLTKKESVNRSTVDMASSNSDMRIDTPVVKPSFATLDATVNAHIKNLLGHYMHIKNALLNNDTIEVRDRGHKLAEAIIKFDDSYFPAKQKAEYDKYKMAMREYAEQLRSSAGLASQKGNFAGLSAHVYELMRDFSTGKRLYFNHCDMAFDKNGANWLSETNEIKNPYMENKMMSCGSVEKILN
jgi:hypothetical protein